MPGVAATALICFIFSWNELMLARTLTGTIASTAPVSQHQNRLQPETLRIGR